MAMSGNLDWLKSVVPTIATALGGPLAGVAATFVADKLGLGDKTVEAVQAAISGASPDQLIQMKQIDADLQKYFASLDIQIEQLENADRDSARNREIKTGDSATPRNIAYIIIFGFFGVLITMMVRGVAPDTSGATMLIVGGLNTSFGAVMGYFFGSTKGSADKTALIAKAASGDKHLP
jgi:hypothetical protein